MGHGPMFKSHIYSIHFEKTNLKDSPFSIWGTDTSAVAEILVLLLTD